MKLWVATTNTGKLREFQLAAGSGVDILPFPPSDPPEETGSTFEKNASLKACEYSRRTSGLLAAEDSGIEVEALGGGPGIHSARFSGADATDAGNNRKLIAELSGVADRRARYVAVIAVAENGTLLATFRGEVQGEIVDQSRGSGGFGYDPHFYYPALGRTFAELTPEQKFEVSHRRRAIDQLLAWLKNRFQVK